MWPFLFTEKGGSPLRKAVLSLGSNLGNRVESLTKAIHAIGLLPGTTVIFTSKFYESPPFDVPSQQNDYINACIVVLTDLSPRTLLGACLGIEAGMGRVRTEYHGARVIDIDLLIYEKETCQDGELHLPHPEILNRAFVLVPLNDLFPEQNALGLDFSAAFARVNRSNVTFFEGK
jgi:2-amino-4-hydroxy-6-hydroxymethyldihydropteridine diphosphokinase